jgi:GDP-4-dehydro-6-deoxy-D-mannose reductase
VRVEHRVDQSLVRAHEVMEVRGSSDKLRAATGWEPAIALETTLRDTMDWWRSSTAPEGS